MTIKVLRADGVEEFFQTQNYNISKPEDFHPLILKVTIYTDSGKRLKCRSRRFPWFYKHFTFKTAKVQDELKRIAAAEKKEN